jgi:hypothetical protein
VSKKSKKTVRKRKSTTKYVWAGNAGALRAFAFIEDRLTNLGFKCVGKYTSTRDVPEAFPGGVGFGITVGRGPLNGRMLAAGGKQGIPVFSLRKQAWSELKDELVDSGFLDNNGNPPKLHGFFDEEAASKPGPVTTPVLPRDFELPQPEDKPEPAPAPKARTHGVFVAKEGEVCLQPVESKQPPSRPVHLIDANMTVRSQTELGDLLGKAHPVQTKQINNGVVADSDGNAQRVRWATVEDALSLPGTFRERDRDGAPTIFGGKAKKATQRPDGTKYDVFREGNRVMLSPLGTPHKMMPVVVDGKLYTGQTQAARTLNISQGELSRCCRENRGTLPDGRACRWADMGEALALDGAWRNEDRDKAKGPKTPAKKKKKQTAKKAKPQTPAKPAQTPPVLKVVPAAKAAPAPAPAPKKEPSDVMKLAAKIEEVRTAKFYTAEVAGVTTKVRMTDDMREKLLSSLLSKLSAAAVKAEGGAS